ncbi:hypothetical protein DERP_008356 [Dermatophagoides pteronyssinus]|uniref:Uncharacterized protein n=1 Tax=Dermatophagoides pteronyssinus TaxID=6956 RepID=A0ABQ8IVD4_DERPT|nr:hypothetical protein DERP_008356 [Dermatophagoides pteronyssinus]
MATPQETHRKRKIALRKFNDYFNSFIDGHGEEIVEEKKEIRNLIEQIRKYNRDLADDDFLFEEELYERFNSQAHRLAKFINNSPNIDDSKEKRTSNQNEIEPTEKPIENDDIDNDNEPDHIDWLLAEYYIGQLELRDDNWFDYYPQMMHFIIFEPKMSYEMRIGHLRKTIAHNAKANELIENETSLTNAVDILSKHFNHLSWQDREMTVKKLIDTFTFIATPAADKKNFREVFHIALHIRYNVRQGFQQKYFEMIRDKLPLWCRCNSLGYLIRMFRAKLRVFDAVNVLERGKYQELEGLFDRLIVNHEPCPICHHLYKCIRCHPVVRCRHLNEFCNRFRKGQDISMSMNNLSIESWK